MNTTNSNTGSKQGFTLVELLVVLVIAATVLAIAIPKIRVVTKERGIREAARIVGSQFAQAGQRATVDGVAGIYISRNTNFLQGATQFAATEFSLMRRIPNYTGDEIDEETFCIVGASNTVEINLPAEHSPSRPVVQFGDEISFQTSNIRFKINSVPTIVADVADNPLTPTKDERTPRLRFTVDTKGYLALPTSNSVSFSVHRLPRILRSSTASMSGDYMVDLRVSGFEVEDVGDPTTGPPTPPQLTTIFEPVINDLLYNTPPGPTFSNYDIAFIFDENGTVERVLYFDTASTIVVERVPLGPLYMFVTEMPDSVDTTETMSTNDPNALWVSISNNSGSTNIGYSSTNGTDGSSFTPPGFLTPLAARTPLSFADLAGFYFGMYDADFDPEEDRDEFNIRVNQSRLDAAKTVNQ